MILRNLQKYSYSISKDIPDEKAEEMCSGADGLVVMMMVLVVPDEKG